MLPVRVPDEAKVAHAPCRLVRLTASTDGAPEQAPVEVLISDDPAPGYDGLPRHFAYYRPTAEDLATIAGGGHLELCVISEKVPPFALVVCPAGGSGQDEAAG